MSRRRTQTARGPVQPIDWHPPPQDWILVVEALCWFASDELVDAADAEDAHQLVDADMTPELAAVLSTSEVELEYEVRSSVNVDGDGDEDE